ncbi:hypothetical protein DESC_700052 [Desulfosarcina cetonica]|nr:hypothetical protein DESC_700052 [Desulfosarcina cetonica]
MVDEDVEGRVADLGGGVGGRVHHGKIELPALAAGLGQKVEGVRVHQPVAFRVDPVELEILTGPGNRALRPIHRNGAAGTALGGIAGERRRIAIQIENILAGGHFADHLAGIAMIGEEPGIHVIVRVDQEPQIPFAQDDFLVRIIDSFVALAVLPAGPALLEMQPFGGHLHGVRHGPAHQGQPCGRRLAPHVFAHDQVAAIPVDDGADFGDIPVIESENIDLLASETLVEMFEAFLDAVGQHLGLLREMLGKGGVVHTLHRFW